MHIIIIGAGPAGLAAALALRQQSTPSQPIRITVLERRPSLESATALGGAVNLTPLAMRYLDALGVGARLRPQGIKVSRIEMVSHRTGTALGRLWPDVDALRVGRQRIVEAMARTAQEISEGTVGKGGLDEGATQEEGISVRYGVGVLRIEEVGESEGEGKVRVFFRYTASSPDPKVGDIKDAVRDTTHENGSPSDRPSQAPFPPSDASENNGSKEKLLECDLLLGCDGIHSFVRSALVDPSRSKQYSGRAGAYGYITLDTPAALPVTTPTGAPALHDTTLVSSARGSLLLSFFEPTRTQVFVAAVISEREKADARDGWRAMGDDKVALKADMQRRFGGGALVGLEELVAKCEEWFFFPVYMLPSGGVWRKERVLLIGDAAHAMPPQGESTGVAIEDGVLLAHVLTRRATRSVPAMLADYEALRRAAIDKLYNETMFRWSDAGDQSWWRNVLIEWVMWLVLALMNLRSQDDFARDVRKLELPL